MIYPYPLDLFRPLPHIHSSSYDLPLHSVIYLSYSCHLVNLHASDSSLCLTTVQVINDFIDWDYCVLHVWWLQSPPFAKDEAPRTVTHFQFNGWTKTGSMPTSAVPLMTLLDLVEESQHGTGHHPVVVHCQYAVHVCFFTGPPAHSVGGQTSNGHWRLSSSSVVCNTPQRQNTTHRGAACDGGPVVLRPVKATPCFFVSAKLLCFRPVHWLRLFWWPD